MILVIARIESAELTVSTDLQRFPKPPRDRCRFQWMHNGFLGRFSYEPHPMETQFQASTLLRSRLGVVLQPSIRLLIFRRTVDSAPFNLEIGFRKRVSWTPVWTSNFDNRSIPLAS